MARRRHKARKAWSLLWAARFVARWEGFLGHAYLDTIASPPVWTIGYGHTGGVLSSWVWSKAHALRVLGHDLRDAARTVSQKTAGKHLTVRQRIALISGVFNCGPGILDDPDIMRPLRRGDWKRVAREWEDWCHAGGVVVQGLLNRRKQEAWMMLHSARPKHHKVRKKDRSHTKPKKRR